MEGQKKISLRDLFHNLGNKHYIVLLGSGVTREGLESVLNRQGLPLECQEIIKKAVKGLDRIEKASQEADILLNEIKKMVYARVNPDEINIDAGDMQNKIGETPQKKIIF